MGWESQKRKSLKQEAEQKKIKQTNIDLFQAESAVIELAKQLSERKGE